MCLLHCCWIEYAGCLSCVEHLPSACQLVAIESIGHLYVYYMRMWSVLYIRMYILTYICVCACTQCECIYVRTRVCMQCIHYLKGVLHVPLPPPQTLAVLAGFRVCGPCRLPSHSTRSRVLCGLKPSARQLREDHQMVSDHMTIILFPIL